LRRELSATEVKLMEATRFAEDQARRRRAAELTRDDAIADMKRLTHAGLCPWCRRSFAKLKAHILAKHPEHGALPAPTERKRLTVVR